MLVNKGIVVRRVLANALQENKSAERFVWIFRATLFTAENVGIFVTASKSVKRANVFPLNPKNKRLVLVENYSWTFKKTPNTAEDAVKPASQMKSAKTALASVRVATKSKSANKAMKRFVSTSGMTKVAVAVGKFVQVEAVLKASVAKSPMENACVVNRHPLTIIV